jgi:hypothetical protein
VFAAVSEFCGETPFNDDCTVVEIAFTGADTSVFEMPDGEALQRGASSQ